MSTETCQHIQHIHKGPAEVMGGLLEKQFQAEGPIASKIIFKYLPPGNCKPVANSIFFLDILILN